LFFTAPASPKDYPGKPVRMAVPEPAGGLVDVAAGQLALRLQVALGRPVVVVNRNGAGGVIGADLVTKAPTDSHTLLLTTSGLIINARAAHLDALRCGEGSEVRCRGGLAPLVLVV